MSRNAELINKFVSRVGKAEAEPARSLRFWGKNYVTVCFLYINAFRVKQYGYMFLFANIRIILFSQIIWEKNKGKRRGRLTPKGCGWGQKWTTVDHKRGERLRELVDSR